MDFVRCQVGKNILTLSKAVEVNMSKRVINLFTVANPKINVTNDVIKDSDKFSNKGVV